MYICLAARLAIGTFVTGYDQYFSFSTLKKKSNMLFEEFLCILLCRIGLSVGMPYKTQITVCSFDKDFLFNHKVASTDGVS
jgi:hypothetical protein